MKVLFNNLSNYKIQKLAIISIEQALYQASVVIEDEEHLVWENDKAILRSRNLISLRQLFEKLEVDEVVLRQESAYDEMIGQPSKDSNNRMEVPLGKQVYPESKD